MSGGPAPVVTGISPKEAAAGTKITIRGENLGVSQADLLGVLIHGADCLMTVEWKSPNKLLALVPGLAKEGSGDIILATRSGGIGTCTVQLKIYRETVGPLKEVAVWTPEKYVRRKKAAAGIGGGGAVDSGGRDDALGLSSEGNEAKLPEDQLQEWFRGKTGDLGAENFDPVYYLLENHVSTSFEDLQAGLGFLKRRVDGENESQLSFIKSNVASIMDQLDTLRSVKQRFEIDKKESKGEDPVVKVEHAIFAAKKEADQMFVDVLGRKDRADSTRNALNVLNRFKFLFYLPANIEANLNKGDFDRIIDEYERAKSLYGDSDSEIFHIYLEEVEKGITILKGRLKEKLKDPNLTAEQQKKIIANLVQLKTDHDPAWECIEIQYGHVVTGLDNCKEEYLERQQYEPVAPVMAENKDVKKPQILGGEVGDHEVIPTSVLFIEEITERITSDFPDLWRVGQAYFKGDLIVEPDTSKATHFKDMILGGIRYYSNVIRAAVIPQTLKEEDREQFGSWGPDNEKLVGQWLPMCLRQVRRSYASLVELDLPGQALEIVKRLTTDLRIQCLQLIFQTVIDQVHSLHEKEIWAQEVTDEYGAITELPSSFETLVSQSVVLIKEALLSADSSEEDILGYENAHEDLELMIQNVLTSFAVTLENVAVEDFVGVTGDGPGSGLPGANPRPTAADAPPTQSARLLLCLNNCMYTQTHMLPRIQKAFQDVGQLSLEKPISEAAKSYSILHGKLMEAYLESKCEAIISLIEPAMYVGKFDWARCPKPQDARDYVKTTIHQVILVHAEVERVSAVNNLRHNYVETIVQRCVEAVAEEVNRLFCCVTRMNSNGCIQAWVDIHCLQHAFRYYLNQTAKDFLSDAAKPLHSLERPGDREVIESCIAEFERKMKWYISSLEVSRVKV